jgi:hypothetical protein
VDRAVRLIERTIAAHEKAIEDLRSLRSDFEAELRRAAIYTELRAAPVRPKASAPAPAPAAAAKTPFRKTLVRRTAPARKDPPPPPGASVRGRIGEKLEVGPMTSAELIQATGCIEAAIYKELKQMREDGTVEMAVDPADGQRKNYLKGMAAGAAQ